MHTRPRTPRRGAVIGAATVLLVVGFPGSAHAAPPRALPGDASTLERTFQPAYDYDKDGCYPTPAIGPDGTVSPGLKPSGTVSGQCRDASDLTNTNAYSRALCSDGWCAVMYDLYFEKDQAVWGSGLGGHRHDWEHVVVWIRDGTAQYVSTSAHGKFSVHGRDRIRWDGTHPKIVYHKDGVGTHCFRAASAKDEPPENHRGAWQFPDLVGWEGYPPGVRDRLTRADFGSAHFGLKDADFLSLLKKAKPAGLTFDPVL
ncbi:hypothetical protein E2C00_00915 [Streptomyces sp. WAC05374]|uniref:NPP1 family protein n=1 Tax=Streptomyces sp. WAC05374 TaxID=2487420 RepID=UPI000F86F6E2|nr:NPP1 family protein [Streptomyces sp. WAC05374]RST19551.1 hypothetical protein EF905_00030 [Streptomyces sp. WAC05374]TDF50112.1 hypothetical protein E2B92_00890 [Streptomyces sp. WAC05374]TDF57838.1 hypothetical protein E2C02_08680 [Streptomyces sp. WAC05374]TDF60366.1 hypothetical protein E2C00_00915 [Streptomyces sp. WAC05374]